MRNFLYLMTALLLFSVGLYSQSYGLQFSSHEAIQEKRTSLNLTPGEPLCLNEDTQISFDLKFVPDLNAYFGYVIRLIKIDSSSLFGKWNHCEIRFDKNRKEAADTYRIIMHVSVECLINLSIS